MIKTTVTPTSKVKELPKPQIGREGYPAGAYNDPKEKGEVISFLPKKVDITQAKSLPIKKK